VGQRTYRVIVRGRFPELTAEQRARLLAEADRHTVFEAEFTEPGTLTYERSLTGWVGRVQVVTEEQQIEDADALAELLGRERLEAILAGFGIAAEDPQLSITCLDDMKINRRAGRR
jgi:hypothetical protein